LPVDTAVAIVRRHVDEKNDRPKTIAARAATTKQGKAIVDPQVA
jgi:hypothetical protein